MMKSPTALISPPSTLTAPKKSVSTEHVPSIHLKQMNTVGYDHKKTKKEMHERVAAIRTKKPKCPLGQKCKDDSCSLHPDQGRKKKNLKKLGNFVPWQRQLNRTYAAKEHTKLQVNTIIILSG